MVNQDQLTKSQPKSFLPLSSKAAARSLPTNGQGHKASQPQWLPENLSSLLLGKMAKSRAKGGVSVWPPSPLKEGIMFTWRKRQMRDAIYLDYY